MPYSVQEVIDFGDALVKTRDLDPVYCTLVGVGLPKSQLKRLLLAYFCFYHLGVSAYLSEYDGPDFWEIMEQAAENQMPPSGTDSLILHNRWPRGAERRHFRGEVCVKAIKWLSGYDPDILIDDLTAGPAPVTLARVMNRVQRWPLFGPWISFKVADVLERVLNVPVEFPNDIVFLYKEPRAALDMLDVKPVTACERLLDYFSAFYAPPVRFRPINRRCNIQEVETVLCKWKSSKNGHYHVGKDIHEIRKGLRGWGATADKLLAAMPPEVERGLFK